MKNKKTIAVLLVGSGILTIGICAVMNLYLIPRIESSTQGIKCFDMNIAYSYDEASRFLSLLSETGKNTYLTRQLPLDFFYPIAYGVFFAFLMITLSGKKTKMIVVPLLLAAFDYCENICVCRMLTSDSLSRTIVSIASAATMIKTILMYLCILLILFLLIKRIATARKKKN